MGHSHVLPKIRALLLSPPPQSRGRSPAGAQRRAESVVSAVPNPKWLLLNCNPIKVLLVYLSSSGLFITVQMAATFARHSSVLARARRTEARAPQSLCLHLRGAGGRLLRLPCAGGAPAPMALAPGTYLHQEFAPGICTRYLHRAFAPGVCLYLAFAPGVCTRLLFAQGICTTHLHQVFAPGICTKRLHQAFICTWHLHRAFALGI